MFTTPEEVRGVVTGCIERFFASEDGAAAAAAAAGLDMPAVVELRVLDPDVRVWIDVAGRRLLERPADPPAAEVTIEADALHHLLLDRLGPVEISRLAEEGRVHLSGPPLVLGALLPLTAAIQPHYGALLEDEGRNDLLAVPGPPTAEVWQSAEPPPGVIGVRRPWQRPRGAA
ncbi:MAG TPA: hypothetical protein VFH74_13245 [Gaiellales bacterium]|nr:hypothetical protein [Gaiellales bacterium]